MHDIKYAGKGGRCKTKRLSTVCLLQPLKLHFDAAMLFSDTGRLKLFFWIPFSYTGTAIPYTRLTSSLEAPLLDLRASAKHAAHDCQKVTWDSPHIDMEFPQYRGQSHDILTLPASRMCPVPFPTRPKSFQPITNRWAGSTTFLYWCVPELLLGVFLSFPALLLPAILC